LRVPIAMPAFYESFLWITQSFSFQNPDLHHGLLGRAQQVRVRSPGMISRNPVGTWLRYDHAQEAEAYGVGAAAPGGVPLRAREHRHCMRRA